MAREHIDDDLWVAVAVLREVFCQPLSRGTISES
jgi:hypothetical protein